MVRTATPSPRKRDCSSSWDSAGPPLAWKASGLGRGYSSIALAGGRIYTMGDRGNQQFVIALDAKDGSEVWATPVGKPWSDGGPRCTPTVDGGMVYAITPAGDLVCLDAKNGKGIWTKNFDKDFKGQDDVGLGLLRIAAWSMVRT